MKVSDIDAPKTLYVSRKVLNGHEIARWAKEQGFEKILNPNDMHVTVVYSDAAISWSDLKAEQPKRVTVKKPHVRSIQEFNKAVVLCFANSILLSRWQEAMDCGASWGYDDYSPHVTLSYSGGGNIDVGSIEPYRGDIVLGPEKFSRVRKSWKHSVEEISIGEAVTPKKFWFHPDDKCLIIVDDFETSVTSEKLGIPERDLIGADKISVAFDFGWVKGENGKLSGGDLNDLRSAEEYLSSCMVIDEVDHVGEMLSEEDSLPTKKFWLAFNIFPDQPEEAARICGQLSDGKLIGLKGISSSRRILQDFLSVGRNTALIMAAAPVLDQNDITPMPYGDVDDLLLNNGAKIKRMIATTSDIRLISHVLLTAFREGPYLLYGNQVAHLVAEALDGQPYNSVDDLTNLVAEYIDTQQGKDWDTLRSPGVIRDAICRGVLYVASLYRDEEEWVVENESLVIPRGSFLLFCYDKKRVERTGDKLMSYEKEAIANHKRLRELIKEYDLESRYEVRFIDEYAFSRSANAAKTRRRMKKPWG